MSCTASRHFIDPHHMRVEGPQGDVTLEADRVIIAVGTKPAASPKVPINGRTIINSDQILGLRELPQIADRGGRRRDRRGIRLHVRGAGRARDAD